MAYYDIGEAFQKIEEEMIASMSRNLKRHLSTEKEEGLNYAMWQAEQLSALNEFKRNNKSLFKDYFSTINEQIEEVLQRAHASGEMEQEIKILEAIREGWSTAKRSSGAIKGEFFKINERKLKALIESVQKDMQKAETAVLRMANDEYRKIIFNSQAYYNTGAGTLPQCVDMATKDFLSKGINCIEYANGARVGIDSYARMAIRTSQTRAYLLGESVKRDEWGINTVIVNKRGVACPRCLQYVGRVFYDDVWGSTPVPSPAKYPRLSDAIAGGLYHPNCKDIHTTYFDGVSTPPEPMTAAEKKEAARVYDLEQQQRYNERQIRKYKRLSAGSVDAENQMKYQEKLEFWQTKQRDFVKANSDVLKRRYENEKLRVPEFSEPPNASATGGRSVNATATELLKKAKAAEPKITDDLQEIVKGTSGRLEGLEYRLKGRDSLVRKIKSDVLEGAALDDVKSRLYDLVRYTECSSSKTLVNDYITTINELESKGYKVLRVKNTLRKKDVAYRGINTVIETPGGYKFELQFHTPESLDIKEKVHKLYERRRIDGISQEEAERLDDEMIALSNSIPDPDDIEAIEPFDTFKGEKPIKARLKTPLNYHKK